MTPLILDAKNRTKENVSVIRHVYIEVDDNGTACLNKIKAELPEPAFILRSSRKGDFDAAKQQMNADDKYQFIWRVTGFEKESQERLLARLIELFGGDPQCKDCVRILRLPGFKNTKYKERPAVETISVNPTREYTSADFPAVPDVLVEKPRFEVPGAIPEGQRNDTLFKLASSLRAKGMGETEIMAACAIANQRCPHPLKPEELKTIVRSALRYDKGPKIEVVNETDVKRVSAQETER